MSTVRSATAPKAKIGVPATATPPVAKKAPVSAAMVEDDDDVPAQPHVEDITPEPAEDAAAVATEDVPEKTLLQKTKEFVASQGLDKLYGTFGHVDPEHNEVMWWRLSNLLDVIKRNPADQKTVFYVLTPILGSIFVKGEMRASKRGGVSAFQRQFCLYLGGDDGTKTRQWYSSLIAAVEAWLTSVVKDKDGAVVPQFPTFEDRVAAFEALKSQNIDEALQASVDAAVEQRALLLVKQAEVPPLPEHELNVPYGPLGTHTTVGTDDKGKPVENIVEYVKEWALPLDLTLYNKPESGTVRRKAVSVQKRSRGTHRADTDAETDAAPAASKSVVTDDSDDDDDDDDDDASHKRKKRRGSTAGVRRVLRKLGGSHKVLATAHKALGDVATALYEYFADLGGESGMEED